MRTRRDYDHHSIIPSIATREGNLTKKVHFFFNRVFTPHKSTHRAHRRRRARTTTMSRPASTLRAYRGRRRDASRVAWNAWSDVGWRVHADADDYRRNDADGLATGALGGRRDGAIRSYSHSSASAAATGRGFAASAAVGSSGRGGNAESAALADARGVASAFGFAGRVIRASPTTPMTTTTYFSARGFAAEPLPKDASATSPATSATGHEEGDANEPIKLDLAALDRARAEIDMMHRARQLKAWERMYASTKSGVLYVASFGPWVLSFAKMSRDEWRYSIKHGWGHFKEEMHHYWSGAKLLWVEVKIASRLSWRLMSGQELSRRERKQLTRTTADVFRLVPFAAFVLIPFMEFLLPVALKIFPNMLPTTFRNDLKHEEELKKKLKAKLEVARFLQDTVRMMAKGLKHSRSGVTRDRADDLYVFMKKIRTGAKVTNEDIMKFSKLFNDEFTLYQVNRAQLVNMCKFVGIAPYGTDTFLRFQLRNKLRDIKNDDKLIYFEGLANMTTAELRSAARSRGMRWEAEREELVKQLEDWLELSLKSKLPSTLLLLSRAFTITAEYSADADSKAKVLQDITDTLASLPEDVVTSAAVDEGLATQTASKKEDYTKRMEFVQREEEIIAEEAKETKAMEDAEKASPASADVAKTEMADVTSEKMATAEESIAVTDSSATAETASAAVTAPSATATAAAAITDKETAAAAPKPEDLTPEEKAVIDEEKRTYEREKRAKRAAQLSRLLTMVSDNSSVSVERAELMMLVKKGIDAYADRIEDARCAAEEIAADQAAIDALNDETVNEEAQLSHELADQVSARVDKMLASASKDIEDVERRIGNKLRVLDADGDGVITMAELLRVRDVLGNETLSERDEIELVNILSGLIKSDGSIAVEDLKKLTSDIICTEHLEDDVDDDDDEAAADADPSTGGVDATQDTRHDGQSAPGGDPTTPP